MKFLSYNLLFSLASKSVFSAVHEALDIRPMLNYNKNRDQKASNPQSQIDFFGRKRHFEVSECRNDAKRDAGADAPDRDVLRRGSQHDPYAETRKCGNRAKRKEHAERGKHALTPTEPGKASEAVTENHKNTRHQRNPVRIVRTTCSHLHFAEPHGNPRAKESLEQVQEHHRKRRFPAQHAERVGEPRILGAVVPNVERAALCEFCYPDRAGDRPQQVRYWKTQ